MFNALSVDLEDWYHPELLKTKERQRPQIKESVAPILNLLDKYNTKATFFVLGNVAENNPNLIKKIKAQGHEIASHGYNHKSLKQITAEEFEKDIMKSKNILKKITGEYPIGYRAPTFSIDNNTKWAIDILEKQGFLYDSSIFPTKTHLYGVPDAPLNPYYPSRDDISRERRDKKGIIEFPMTVLPLKFYNLPTSGGFYLRLLPNQIIKAGIKNRNKKGFPAMLYIHPWETYSKTPRIRHGLISDFINYHGIDYALDKLESLLTSFKFKPVKSILFD
ncbi:MAG: DUF3473 domain-containing protein [Nanohaloarchaea archaeon]|nr:DUF3473 domain-containing protein [Candidatus Nanohaloarchaea archaeon]